MNILKIKYDFQDLKQRLLFNFNHLCEQDLSYDPKNEEIFMIHLQNKLGCDRMQLLKLLDKIQAY